VNKGKGVATHVRAIEKELMNSQSNADTNDGV
jgi:hypothetical protein